MLLPGLLSKRLLYCELADSDEILLQMLANQPFDLVDFFVACCEDQAWAMHHPSLLKLTLAWLTDRFFEDQISLELAKKVARTIQSHWSFIQPYMYYNITCSVEGEETPVNALLLGCSCSVLRELMIAECLHNNTKKLILIGISPKVFGIIEHYSRRGEAIELWKHDRQEIVKVLEQAQLWEMDELSFLCQDLLKRYLSPKNAAQTLISAKKNSQLHLKKESLKFLTNLNIGASFFEKGPLSICMEFTEFNHESMDLFEELQGVLTHLSFRHQLTQEPTFSTIVTSCPNLVGIDISQTNTYSDRILDLPTNLEELEMAMCPWLRDEHLKDLLNRCPQLTSINLSSNVQLKYPAWAELYHLAELKSLNISQCLQIRDEDFNLILRACRNVETLDLEGCTRISEQALFELARTASELTNLNLSRCNVNDAVLIEIASRCRNLTSLKIARCKGVSSKGILEAARYATQLAHLDISQCSVPETVISEIANLRPRLEITQGVTHG